MLKTTIGLTKKIISSNRLPAHFQALNATNVSQHSENNMINSLSQNSWNIYSYNKLFLTWTNASMFATKGSKAKNESKVPKAKSKKPFKKEDELKFNEVDDQTSIHNSQSFFMKCKELLPDHAIEDLVHKINSFKAKIHSQNFKSLDLLTEKAFLQSCLKIFEKNDSVVLMDYLINVNILHLNTKMLNNTIFDFESIQELSDKINKFKSFAQQSAPASSYVIQREEKYDEHMTPTIEKGYVNILTKASKIEFAKHDDPINNEPAENVDEASEDLKFEKLDDSQIDAQIEGVENQQKSEQEIGNLGNLEEFGQATAIINDMDGEGGIDEGENVLGLMSDAPVRHEINTEEETAPKTLRQKNESFVLKKKELLKKQLARELNNVMLFKTQGNEELIYLSQKGFENREVKKTNWIYIYGLPYEVTDEQALKEDLRSSFRKTIGEVKSIKLFQFKDYLDISNKTKSVKVYESLEEVFDPEHKIANQQRSLTGGVNLNQLNVAQEVPSPALIEKKMEAAKQRLKKTDAILQNIKAKSTKRLDKSYALVELGDENQKTKALSSDIRIFGIYVAGRLCQIDDADYKTSLSCYNVHWGAAVKNFADFINQKFEENNMMDLKVTLPKEFENKILTKFYIVLRFNSFFNGLRAMKTLENLNYENRQLRVHHLYGSLKIHEGKYSEVLDISTNASVQDRVNKIRSKEKSKIITFLEEEDKSHDWSTGSPTFDALETEDFGIDNEKPIVKIEEDNENIWFPGSSQSDNERYDGDLDEAHEAAPSYLSKGSR